MNIEFEDKALEELYENGHTAIKPYNRRSKDVIVRYVKVVNYMKAACRIENLYLINSLHYEKKKGNLKGVDVVRINDKYRLHFRSTPNKQGIVVNAIITDITKHYE